VIDTDGEEKKVWDNPTQDEINKMDTPFFHQALRAYLDFKIFGLPSASGQLSERNTLVEIIRILDNEAKRYEGWYMKHYEEIKGDEEDD
jgi:hypothetical protein